MDSNLRRSIEVVVLMLMVFQPFQGVQLALAKDYTKHRGDHIQMSAEKRLIRKVMGDYARMGKAGRPVRNSSVSVKVDFGLGLKQMDLDEKQKILTMSMWTRYLWRDEYLVWSPDEYEGVMQLTVDPQDIWIPDIMLINTADIDVPARSTMAVVSNSGMVSWYPHCIYHSACSVDVSNFPFDKQKCNLAFGSWTHPFTELDVEMSFPGGLDLSTFESENRESSAWEILNVTAKRQILPEVGQPQYAILTFELSLARKLVFSTYILTLPCVFLAFLTLVVFWLPPERPDRTALAMSTFSSFMVLLLILVEAAPPTANTIPLLGVYYCINMVIIVMTVVLSTLVINLSRGPKDRKSRPPAWLSAVALKGLARAFCMPSIYLEVTRRSHARAAMAKEETEERTMMLGWQTGNIKNGGDHRGKTVPQQFPIREEEFHGVNDNSDTTLGNSQCFHLLKLEMERTRKSMERLENTLSQTSNAKYDDIMWEWRSVAMVIDRFFFALYILVIGLSLAFFFPRPKTSANFDLG